MQKLTELSGQLAHALTKHGSWTEAEQVLAVQLAYDVLNGAAYRRMLTRSRLPQSKRCMRPRCVRTQRHKRI
jgi:hypothetical protein